MSNIPKSQRPKSRLETLDDGYNLRGQITANLMTSFAFNKNKIRDYIKKRFSAGDHSDPDKQAEVAERLQTLTDDFIDWFVKRERDRVADFCQGITEHLVAANKIYPTLPDGFLQEKEKLQAQFEHLQEIRMKISTSPEVVRADYELQLTQALSQLQDHINTMSRVYNEFQERRLELDRAIECCGKLEDELQYIAETLFADKNKYSDIMLNLNAIETKIKNLRQSDNRFLREPQKARRRKS